ncbi:hypothetical protein [Desulfovibrio cuneatus]|uniref:hypothetical protein n=1 Tax=Desulfovibrio cuneatus TaxID=159728 RepID=UPI000411DA3C|nr:hypothetical protein [Desulfovibrio cuneatus]
MQAPTLYFLDTDSFLTSSRPAQLNPATGEYMIDALGAVLTSLPDDDLPEHHRWRLVQGAWVATPDHRGQEGFLPDGSPCKIETWGPLPEGWTVEKPVIPPTLNEARTAKLGEINAGYSAVMGFIQAGYPAEEVLSWERQATQARELTQNPEAEAAFVRGLAATKNLTVEEMTARILVNAASWEPIAAMLTGQRQVMEEIAYIAETVEGVQAIKVAYRV